MNKIYVVGIGPGDLKQMTIRCHEVIKECDVVVGYNKYVELIGALILDKDVYKSGMRTEVERCKTAVEKTLSGNKVALVSSGDSGVYGMAGLVYEIIRTEGLQDKIEIEVVPGISASQSAASLLGAPLMHDFVTISLSDWLTDISLIEKRLHVAGEGDFVVVIYNPKSKARPDIIDEASDILLEYKSDKTPVGIVRDAYRQNQSIEITTLGEMTESEINMTTTIIIGNHMTFTDFDKIITPRGYKL
ncbi:MAG: precorrin-3B C(17)-methyltransferase [Bacillota bacterium]|nr:precorrin-3B C(17)-methyltransferase [Bacillota bacterium]